MKNYTIFLATLLLIFGNYSVALAQKEVNTKKKAADNDNVANFSSIQYTDLQGFSNDKPNGILQQEVRFTYPIFSSLGKDNDDSKDFRFWLFKSITFPSLIFNRIDKSNKSTSYPIGKIIPESSENTDSLSLFLTTMDLYKYNNFQASASVVVAALKMRTAMLQLQYGIGFLRNKPYYVDTFRSGSDSGRVADDLRPVYSFVNKIEINFQNVIEEKFSVYGAAGLMFITLRDSKYEQFDVTELDQFDRATKLLSVNNSRSKKAARPILYASALIEKPWNNNKNTIFFRINYFYQGGQFENLEEVVNPNNTSDITYVKYNDYYHNHFLQLQVGVSLGLEKVFGIDTSDEVHPQVTNNFL